MTVPKFASAGLNTSDLPAEALVVESELERDLAMFASRLASYKTAGASKEMCSSALSNTGFRLVTSDDHTQFSATYPIVGAVVAGTLSISYFVPRRHPEIPQQPILCKKISAGSSFYITRNTDAVFTASPNTWLIVRDGTLSAGTNPIDLKTTDEPDCDCSLLSDGALLGRIGAIDFGNFTNLVVTARPLLTEIASRRDLLRKLLSSAKNDPKFRGDCELLSEFYKYVLHRAPNGTRLRLHVFRP